MTRRIARELSAAIRRLIAGVAEKDDLSKEVAEATGALLVYRGWTAGLAVTPEGEVVEYDWEWDRGKVTVPDANWRNVALRTAAQKFPELQDLAPPRPSSAVTCPACDGSGFFYKRVGCGICWQAGWIVLPKDRAAAKRVLAEAAKQQELLRQFEREARRRT
jgi:hypothetical protein